MNKTSNYLSIMSIKINNYYSFIENNDKINRLPSGTFFYFEPRGLKFGMRM